MYNIEIDPELHKGKAPEDEVTRITWETLDTAWNVLRDGAVRTVLQTLREDVAGPGFPATDEELFKLLGERLGDDAPKSYRDLAPRSKDAAALLAATFGLLEDQALSDAIAGLGLRGE